MWLTAGLKPTYKTISDFRKNNPKALKAVFKDFVLLLKGLALIGDELVALDGAFLRANASKNTLMMKKTTQRDLASTEASINEYLSSLEFRDEETHTTKLAKQLPRTLEIFLKKKARFTTELNFLKKINRTQYNRTDPDASVMVKSAHNLMAYNSQICVDDKFKFIVATDVTSSGTDKQELHHMAMQTKEVITNPDLLILADKGYYSAVEIKKCIDDGIKTLVPAIRTGQELINKGKFTKDKFVYDKDQDAYICPNDKLISRTKSINKSYARIMHMYRSSQSDCNTCSIRDKCLGEKTKQKQTQRWEHQELLDKYNKNMKTPEASNSNSLYPKKFVKK